MGEANGRVGLRDRDARLIQTSKTKWHGYCFPQVVVSCGGIVDINYIVLTAYLATTAHRQRRTLHPKLLNSN